jgi:HEPN domain-containing protein
MEDYVIDVDKICRYWLASSDSDYDAMQNLYRSKNYNWALFLGHIVLEKLIKACHIKNKHTHAPFTHDLRLLANKAELIMPDVMILQLDVITGFNINARYDTFKEDFYRKCTPDYSREWIENIKKIRLWIKENL